jgi:dipeptidyl aminopeptidase/acylaminoacyl peptidase
MRRALVAFAFLAVGRLSAAPPLVATHDIVPADYAQVKLITEFAVSPNGKQVAYCLATWDEKGDTRTTDLWVIDTDGRDTPKQLTTDRAKYRTPKWSTDGKALYVLASRGEKAKTQVWKVPLEGKPEAMTDVKEGVVAFDYAPKSSTLFYTVDATATDYDEFAELRKKYDKIEFGHGKRTVSELYALPVGGKPAKLIAQKRYIREFAVTVDGNRIALVTALDDTVIRSEGESRVDVWEKGKIVTPPTDVYRAKAASPYAWLEGLVWNPEGTRFAFCAIFDAYPTEIILGEWSDEKWQTSRMDRPKGVHVRGYGSPLKWSANDTLVGLGEQAGSVGLLTYAGPLGMGTANIVPNQVVYGLDVVPGTKTSVVLRSVPDGFPELFAGLTKLTDLNPVTVKWRIPSIEHVTWKAPDGAPVGGPLELPFGYDGKRRLPLVVAIHGGPTTASYNDLRFDPHNGRLYFAARGYAVLCPNYRGSTGYGDKFLTDLIGNENDLDVKDIVAGIEHLIKVGIADPNRIAVMGWSNGGYLTNCMITMKDPAVKIRAASSGAGILDTVAEWGFNDEPAYPIVFKKGLPWEQPDNYRKTSPGYGIGNVTTPTLIHVGGHDDRCPPGHSRMLYRALKEYKQVPTQLNVYPGQPHGLGKLSFRTAKMEWDLAWFDKYLKK